MKKRELWNRCDICGKFIAYNDFDKGALRRLDTPDSAYSSETYETLCVKHTRQEYENYHINILGQIEYVQ